MNLQKNPCYCAPWTDLQHHYAYWHGLVPPTKPYKFILLCGQLIDACAASECAAMP